MRTARIILGYVVSFTVFAVAIPAAVIAIGRAVDTLLSWQPMALWPVNLVAAALLGALGVVWMIWSWWFLLTRGHGHPTEGFGIEVSPVTQELVTAGPYARTRNPMGFGYILVLLALSAVVSSAGMLVGIAIVAAVGVVAIVCFEEPRLVRRFGDPYLEYRRRVPRFLPRGRARR